MENMRQRFDLGLKAVGRPSQPRKGAVSEDLGSSNFTSGPSRQVAKSSRKPKAVDSSDSDDEIDAFSSKNKSSSFIRKSKVPERKAKSPCKGKSNVSRPKARQIPKAIKDMDVDENKSAQSVRRPRPRPAFDTSDSFDWNSSMPPSNQLALESKRSRQISEDDGHISSPLEELSPNAKRLKVSKGEKKSSHPARFPMDVENVIKVKKPSKPAPFPVAVTPPKRPEPAPFPVKPPSPLCQKPLPPPRAAQPFPMDDLSTSHQNDSDDELKMSENDAIITYGGPRPFPMSLSQYPVKRDTDSPILARTARKFEHHGASFEKRSSPEPYDLGESSLDDDDDDVDPSTICPYCDEPWPSTPSPTLISLLERTKRKSYADPRHGNPMGLKAPLAAFVELCQRHRFEMTHLPLAHARGWPTRIKFAKLPKRIGAFRKELKRLLDQPSESQFWREIRDDAKAVGTTKVVSVTGQYATFERTQPGYYGEQGSIIIHQSLYSLFPPDSISPTSILPLTPDQFLTRVLVPETAVLLIQEDMGLATKEEAMDVLDESKQYGVAMFPEQAQDEKVAEVGEHLARERARARRKVLEARGEADADVRREVEQEKRQVKRAKVKGKGKAKESDTDGDSVVSGKKEKSKSKDLPEAAVIEPGHRRWERNGDVEMEDDLDELTPRPVKVDNTFREESSTACWRSNRSPSTSPMGLQVKASSSSPSKSNRAFPLSSQSSNCTTSNWTFRLQDDDCDIAPEDVAQASDDIATTSKHTQRWQAESGDSDVVVIGDTDTPKARPKARQVLKKHPAIALCSGESESEGTSDVISSKSRPRPRKKKQETVVEKDPKAKGLLGQTKRKKKVKVVEDSSDGWLLNDPSSD